MLDNGEVLGGVTKFCYLGDMLNGEGGSDSAVITRVRCGWNKFRELSGILTHRSVSWKVKGKVYASCVRSAMIYGSETWALTSEQESRLDRAEMRMARWMCGVRLKERNTNAELRNRLGIEKIGDVVKRSRLRWLGHVLRKDEDDWVRKSMSLEVDGNRGRGRPKLTWQSVVTRDMKACGLRQEDAQNRQKWRRLSWKAKGQPPTQWGTKP